MITPDIEKAVRHFVEEIICTGTEPNDGVQQDMVAARTQEMLTLMRAEAVNLADRIIGKDKVMRSNIGVDDKEYFEPADKAVYDFQFKQRMILSEYQKPLDRGGVPTGPETLIDSDLSPNEA